ncbi:hypothetical protein [Sorangium sp. So ce406]|uniref:hypothetical protein n=1 Tax=Sorangium sp. So ce406 TaxID=3133311 RepID=UPI003F5BF7C1
MGSIIQAARERRVAAVEGDGELGEVAVYFAEDLNDMTLHVNPAHLAHIDQFKASGWDVEEERALRVRLQERISRQGRPISAGQN